MTLIAKWQNFAKFNFDHLRYQAPIHGSPRMQYLYRVLHGHDPNDSATRYLDRGIAVLILVSVTLDLFLEVQNSQLFLYPIVKTLDWLATIALTSEFLLKWWLADLDPRLIDLKFKRLRFLSRPMSIIDLIVLIPSWLSMFMPWHLFFLQFIRIIRLAELVHPVLATVNRFLRETRGYSFRRRTYSAFFGGERDHGIPGVIDFIIFAMIMLSILLMTLESVDWMRIQYKPKFHALDMIVTFVFIFEYLCRLYCCVENEMYRRPILGRIRYMLSASAIIDFIAIMPFFLAMVSTTTVPWLWALRLLRMLKLGRYSKSVSTIMAVIREERAVLSAAIMMLFLLTIFAASGIYVAEHAAQPDKFTSIPVSMYWAVITLTSIGYGDYYPITPIGQALTMMLAIAGLGMIALPAGILANGFSQRIKSVQKSRHHKISAHAADRDEHHAAFDDGAPLEHDDLHHFTSMDQVLRSPQASTRLRNLITPLNHAEREALIAITAISLQNDL